MLGDFLTLREFLERFRKIENVTLLGIGPVSTNTIIAALSAALEYDFPFFLIASRNQVDKAEFGVTETKSLLRLSCRAPSGEAFRKVLTEQVFSETRWRNRRREHRI